MTPSKLRTIVGVAGLAVAITASTACGSRTEPAVDDAAGSAAPGATVSCDPARDSDLSVKTRKDRVAKGVFYASRRLAVDRDLELWDTPYGKFWVVAGNFRTFAEVLAEQAVDIYGDEARGVQAGDIVLDGGAHFGGFTRKALDRGARLVVAIEIAPENVECLRRNFAAEIAAGRVIVYPKGVWDKEGTMVLERRNNTWADHVVDSGAGPTVAVTTIDALVADLKLPAVNFIKLDIEGAERNALAGAAATLQSHQPRMAVASYHEPDDVDVLPRVALTAQPGYGVCVSNRSLGHGYTTLFFK